MNSDEHCDERSDEHWVSEAVPSRIAQSWPWDSQIAGKKNNVIHLGFQPFLFICMDA